MNKSLHLANYKSTATRHARREHQLKTNPTRPLDLTRFFFFVQCVVFTVFHARYARTLHAHNTHQT